MNDVKKGSILNDIRIIKALMKMVKYKQEGNKISTNNKKVRQLPAQEGMLVFAFNAFFVKMFSNYLDVTL